MSQNYDFLVQRAHNGVIAGLDRPRRLVDLFLCSHVERFVSRGVVCIDRKPWVFRAEWEESLPRQCYETPQTWESSGRDVNTNHAGRPVR